VGDERLKNAKWYNNSPSEPVAVPVLGPDLIDPRKNPNIIYQMELQDRLKDDRAAVEPEK
jgi:hypothetical protein